MNFPSALKVLAAAIASAIAPPTELTPSAWAAQNLVLVEGPRAGQLWDPTLTPYVGPIIDEMMCGPHTKGVVRKSAQTGFTEGLKAIVGWVACEAPARVLFVLPTTGTALVFNRDKLAPTIEASPTLKNRIYDLSKKGTLGSTAQFKAYPGGSCAIVGANSAADLQMHTIKIALCDEVDQYPKDLEKQGSPMRMIDARQISFHATNDYKKLIGGTPTQKGGSLVDSEFESGDQQYLKMPCPHCGTRISFHFGGYSDGQSGTGLRFNKTRPVDAHYIAQCCGARIEHWQKPEMVRAGEFEATCPAPGRHPSWHLDALISLLTTWDKIAEAYIDAGDNPNDLMTFYNYWLGQAFEQKGDAPEHEALFRRREDYAERVIPPDVLLTTMAVDVQKRGLYCEIVGFTPDRRSYTLYAEYLPAGTVEKPGDTADSDDVCWRRLSELFSQPLLDSSGKLRRINVMGIDCRYNAPVVYDFVRRHHGAYALRTVDGWNLPAMSSMQMVDFDWRGKRIKRGVCQWKVGSYSLKNMIYAHLRREESMDDEGVIKAPSGYCHFGTFLPLSYFQQLTDEYIGQDKAGRRVWKARTGQNHYLDCRMMNYALAYGSIFDIRNRSPEWWQELADQYGAPADLISALITPAPAVLPEAQAPQAPVQAPAAMAAPSPESPAWSYNGTWL